VNFGGRELDVEEEERMLEGGRTCPDIVLRGIRIMDGCP
jgi:hypothetical protein